MIIVTFVPHKACTCELLKKIIILLAKLVMYEMQEKSKTTLQWLISMSYKS